MQPLAMGYVLQKIDEQRRNRYMKFPSLKSRYNFDYSQRNTNEKNGITRENVDEELQPIAPHRLYDSLIDPTSGFVCAGCDVDGAGYGTPSFAHLNHPLKSMILNSDNKRQTTLEHSRELKCFGTWHHGTPTSWNSRKTLDVWIRAQLGGWTSDVDSRKSKNIKIRPQTSPMREQTQIIQDKLTIKNTYGSSTQRGYEDVPWDSILRPKNQPPTSTGEDRSDIALYHRNAKRCNQAVQDLQALDHDSQKYLLKHQFNTQGLATRHEAFEKSEPYDWRTSSIHSREQIWSSTLDKPHSDYRRKSRMSKMVTLVPPYNAFNVVEKVPIQV